MTNIVKRGSTLDYTNASGSTIAAGAAILINDVIAFAVADIANGASGPVEVGPDVEVEVNAATGAWLQGEDIYWNAGSSVFTTSATGNTLVAVASRAKTTAATTGYIRPNVHS